MRRHPNRRGFTLIELVASAVLTAMLTAALMSVVWSAFKHSAQLRQSESWRASTAQLGRQLRRDFQNARGMAVTPTTITLHGFLDHDRRNGLPTMRPGTVRYSWLSIDGRKLLVRNTEGPSGSSRSVIWIGCDRLTVEPFDVTSAEDALVPHPVTGGLPSMPGSFRLAMIGEQGRVLWREVIHHHED